MKTFLRILLLPLGLLSILIDLAIEGSRNIHNRIRFKGVIIDRGSCFNAETTIGFGSHIFRNCILNSVKIGSYSYINRNCLIQNTTIGRYCSIANDVMIGLGAHPLENFSSSPLFYRKSNPLGIDLIDQDTEFIEYKQIKIGHDVWIGAKATVMDGVSIGNGVVIAAGALVNKDVPDYAIVGGVPAKVIKYRFDEEKQKRLLESKWWELEPLDAIKLKDSLKLD